jgi:N-acetylmuramoyl-L-alanine amidase
MALCALLTVTYSAYATVVVVDPGHGGGRQADHPPNDGLTHDPGSAGFSNVCDEDDFNLKVGQFLCYLLWSDWRFGLATAATRLEDVYPTLTRRVQFADDHNANVFVSLHHNSSATNPTLMKGAIEYDKDPSGAQYPYYPESQAMAASIASAMNTSLWAPRGITNGGALEDMVYSSQHNQVLRDNFRIAVLGETFFMGSVESQAMCAPGTQDAEVTAEGYGYYNGLCNYYGMSAIGNSFVATQDAIYPNQVKCSWTESDPTRNVTYYLMLADNCWGPFYSAAVVAHDQVPYTGDGVHYRCWLSLPYDRPYVVRIYAAQEMSEQTVYLPNNGMPPALPPSAPTSLTASGTDTGNGLSTVQLAWTAGTGTTTINWIYRSQFAAMANCNSAYLLVGHTAGTQFNDTTAPTAVNLHYRVKSFNNTGGSPLSLDAQVNVPRTVAVPGHGQSDRPEGLVRVGPNPSAGMTTITFAVARKGRVDVACYDVSGRRVATPVSMVAEPGEHIAMWNGQAGNGRALGPGVYFVQMRIDNRIAGHKRVVLVK